MTQINKECLARAIATVEGEQKLFDMSKIEDGVSISHYDAYMHWSNCVIKQYEKELENHES